jgi:tripartite-type tricarboxylate transporter receptor subunit TctC
MFDRIPFPRLRHLLPAFALVLATGAMSANYPSKPIELVVPYTPGGFADTLARMMGDSMGKTLGQVVVVQNRPGANGNIASAFVARAPADGYTILLSTISTMTINPYLYKNAGFDPVKDFAPISLLVDTTNVVVVNPKSGITSIKDLIDQARANPGKLTFGSSGNGSTLHLSGELFKQMVGVDMVHVPYKGGAPALVDLMGGQITTMFSDTSAIQHIQSGKLTALAVTSSKRLAALPNVPTVGEAGLPGYMVEAWYGLVAPKGTPKEAIAQLNAAIAQALQKPEIREKLRSAGSNPVENTSSEHFGKVIESDMAKWSQVIKSSKITLD